MSLRAAAAFTVLAFALVLGAYVFFAARNVAKSSPAQSEVLSALS